MAYSEYQSTKNTAMFYLTSNNHHTTKKIVFLHS
jgi:hypothetical protein